MNPNDTKMYMSGESLLIILVVGVIAGWLSGHIAQGTGFGIVGDLFIGIVGTFIGNCATFGALVLLLIIRIVRGGGGCRASWQRRW
jgi:uncharacterized membrane protein YeaQ/YmgE (transglycosylase-associated protein family)